VRRLPAEAAVPPLSRALLERKRTGGSCPALLAACLLGSNKRVDRQMPLGMKHFQADDMAFRVIVEDDAWSDFLALDDRRSRKAEIGSVRVRIVFQFDFHLFRRALRSRKAVGILISRSFSTQATRRTRPPRFGIVR
jgi:hypothetical protein